MIKTKLFPIPKVNDSSKINEWLEANPNIEVISTNSFANMGGWGYIILYKETSVGNDADEVD